MAVQRHYDDFNILTMPLPFQPFPSVLQDSRSISVWNKREFERERFAFSGTYATLLEEVTSSDTPIYLQGLTPNPQSSHLTLFTSPGCDVYSSDLEIYIGLAPDGKPMAYWLRNDGFPSHNQRIPLPLDLNDPNLRKRYFGSGDFLEFGFGDTVKLSYERVKHEIRFRVNARYYSIKLDLTPSKYVKPDPEDLYFVVQIVPKHGNRIPPGLKIELL